MQYFTYLLLNTSNVCYYYGTYMIVDALFVLCVRTYKNMICCSNDLDAVVHFQRSQCIQFNFFSLSTRFSQGNAC